MLRGGRKQGLGFCDTISATFKTSLNNDGVWEQFERRTTLHPEQVEYSEHLRVGAGDLWYTNQASYKTNVTVFGRDVIQQKACLEVCAGLEPLTPVLIRDVGEPWDAALFSRTLTESPDGFENVSPFMCSGQQYFEFCIPYVGNESLLGTEKDPFDPDHTPASGENVAEA